MPAGVGAWHGPGPAQEAALNKVRGNAWRGWALSAALLVALAGADVQAKGAKGGKGGKVAKTAKGPTYEPHPLDNGLFLPYPLDNLFRGFAECYRGEHGHKALDIGGVGPDWGVGTPIRAIAHSKITHIGTPEDNPAKYGRRDMRRGRADRARTTLPRSRDIPGYGRVYFFTRSYGSSRTGVIITTRVLDGPLEGYTVRYMHMSAVHPSLQKGSVVAGGQEIGLMGGTAVQTDAPHLHLSIANPQGEPVDVGPLLGVGPTRVACSRGRDAQRALRKKYSQVGRALMAKLRRAAAKRRKLAVAIGRCQPIVEEGELRQAGGGLPLVKVPAEAKPGRWRASLRVTGGRWRPRIEVFDESGKQRLHTGTWAKKFLIKRFAFVVEDGGQRSKTARLAFSPRPGQGLTLRLGPWKAKQRKRPPRSAKYKLVLERPCDKASAEVSPGASEGAPTAARPADEPAEARDPVGAPPEEPATAPVDGDGRPLTTGDEARDR